LDLTEFDSVWLDWVRQDFKYLCSLGLAEGNVAESYKENVYKHIRTQWKEGKALGLVSGSVFFFVLLRGLFCLHRGYSPDDPADQALADLYTDRNLVRIFASLFAKHCRRQSFGGKKPGLYSDGRRTWVIDPKQFLKRHRSMASTILRWRQLTSFRTEEERAHYKTFFDWYDSEVEKLKGVRKVPSNQEAGEKTDGREPGKAVDIQFFLKVWGWEDEDIRSNGHLWLSSMWLFFQAFLSWLPADVCTLKLRHLRWRRKKLVGLGGEVVSYILDILEGHVRAKTGVAQWGRTSCREPANYKLHRTDCREDPSCLLYRHGYLGPKAMIVQLFEDSACYQPNNTCTKYDFFLLLNQNLFMLLNQKLVKLRFFSCSHFKLRFFFLLFILCFFCNSIARGCSRLPTKQNEIEYDLRFFSFLNQKTCQNKMKSF